MKKWLTRILIALLALTPVGVWADYTATQGAGSVVFAFVCSTTKICPATVLIDSTNVEKATSGNPLRTDPTGTTTQPISAASLPLPAGAATAAGLTTINTTLGTPMQQTGGSVAPSTLAAWGLVASTQNGATPTNAQLVMGQFNTSPTTITSGNVSPFQLDAAGNLLVNIKAGAGSGGTASNFGSAFPSAGTAIGLTDGTNMVGWSATTNYGTAPAAIKVPAVNAFVTNSNNNGQALAASSSPVVLANDQVCLSAATLSMSTATTTQIVAANGSNNIFICDIEISANGATNVNLTKGTGTNCGTGTGQVGQKYYASAAGWAKAAANNFYRGLNTGASQALCVTNSAAQTVDVTVFYNQR